MFDRYDPTVYAGCAILVIDFMAGLIFGGLMAFLVIHLSH